MDPKIYSEGDEDGLFHLCLKAKRKTIENDLESCAQKGCGVVGPQAIP